MNIDNKNVKVYISKVNIVQDYIEENLDKELSVEGLSKIVNFSPYYFHRLFKFVTNESLYGYIKRLRLEKSLFLLKNYKDKSIIEIALEIGFSNQASFAKAFRSVYGISASDFRKGENIKSTNDSEKLKISREDNSVYIFPTSTKIENIDEKKLIYIRHTGYYKGDGNLFSDLFGELYLWANARNLVKDDSNWIAVYHDRSDFTEDDKLRVSVCLEVNEDIFVTGIVGKCILEGGKYAIGRFEVKVNEYQSAWNYMYYDWLPESGYKIDDRIPYEQYSAMENSIDGSKRVVYIYIPIIPL